ncbi:hypothetical protein ROZALSC1DRAFT_27607 [Rozella allomycis CSF55]|uniref:Zinc finger, C2H2 domain-containing protein n=1 Tax=Rozella allomycis (strain CSF55) TaxID=988480 RepID=A0A075AQU5_ROZAC|nr:Zinc finger, C2H2 domain-containing protein [Rozella allomycis CSF55]RKP20955.1 hypothetical protein ROZALSC1DRAFT_27607 [Rozella allomycis CSF55]|eukprot:EPZ32555.1 Zinc finger, C2H2 domain-containing protein [Rozella allomycis CSF55]
MHAPSLHYLLNPTSPVPSFDDAEVFSPKMEETFCNNFVCCGQSLPSFHDLLKHYEESHVRIEEDEVPKESSNDSKSSGNSPYNRLQTSQPEKNRKKKHIMLDIEPCKDSANDISAFDNTVLRRTRSLPRVPQNSNSSELSLLMAALGIYGDQPLNRYSYSSESLTMQEYSTFGNDDVVEVVDEEDMYSEKPYACKVNGCLKRYKNANGLKYHMINGHCGGKVDEKPYHCPYAGCGKRYKNPNGLKYHLATAHTKTESQTTNPVNVNPANPANINMVDSNVSKNHHLIFIIHGIGCQIDFLDRVSTLKAKIKEAAEEVKGIDYDLLSLVPIGTVDI